VTLYALETTVVTEYLLTAARRGTSTAGRVQHLFLVLADLGAPGG